MDWLNGAIGIHGRMWDRLERHDDSTASRKDGREGNEEISFSCMYCTNFYQRAVVGVSVRVGDDET